MYACRDQKTHQLRELPLGTRRIDLFCLHCQADECFFDNLSPEQHRQEILSRGSVIRRKRYTRIDRLSTVGFERRLGQAHRALLDRRAWVRVGTLASDLGWGDRRRTLASYLQRLRARRLAILRGRGRGSRWFGIPRNLFIQ